jgi:spore maturation protein CgeB
MQTGLRILVVLPLYGGSLPVGRYCLKALGELGHMAEAFEAPDFHPSFTALKKLRLSTDRLDYLENSFLSVVSQAVLAKVESFRPELVLALAQAPLNRQALTRLRRDGVPTAMWFVEDFRLFTYWRAYAPLYDFFAVIQGEDFLDELYQIGVENSLYLPLAADPSFHRPLDLSPVERRKFGSDLSFLGAGYPNRRKAFKRLTRFDFKIWGTEWEGDPDLEPHLQLGGARVSSEDAVKIFNASKINLNLHSGVRASEAVTLGDFVNPRTFELAACGGFQLVDRRGLMDELFEPEELTTFESMDELEELIEHYLARPEERREAAERSRARVLEDHTYARRMQSLIEFIDQRLEGGLGRSPAEEQRFPPGFPPELAQEISKLLDGLGLPPDAPFEDVIEAVRARHGELSETETALLFLDEWRKQYG